MYEWLLFWGTQAVLVLHGRPFIWLLWNATGFLQGNVWLASASPGKMSPGVLGAVPGGVKLIALGATFCKELMKIL